jgi:hypothetical protein
MVSPPKQPGSVTTPGLPVKQWMIYQDFPQR